MPGRPLRSPGSRIPSRRAAVLLAVVVVASFVLGALTAIGQGRLPDGLSPLANSVGSWSLVAFVLASATRSLPSAAVGGASALAGLLAGYVLWNAARGLPSGSALIVFWGISALMAGPLLGLAGHCVRHRRDVPAGLGIGFMSGILVGEGVYGLRYIADTTPAPYWWASVAVGLLMLAARVATRLRRTAAAGAAVLTTLVVAAAFVVVYASAGTVMGQL